MMMTTTLLKFVLGNCLIILIALNLSTDNQPDSSEYITIVNSGSPTKLQALNILANKCNVCHEKRNKRRVFTTANMDGWADDIYKQVFVKKRMPKGKNIKLSTKEYQDLLTWISSTKN